jgi:uncharacterized protein YwlG (UPF0340 family)
VHSPFVYKLVDEGFYENERLVYNIHYNNTSPGLPKQALKTLLKTLSYFKSYKLLVLGEDEAAVNQATETIRSAAEAISAKVWFYSTFVPVPDGVDLAYLCGNDTATLLQSLEQLKHDIKNNSIAVIPNIHATDAMEAAWHAIKKDPNVTVTIDTYHLGLIFFRREQTRQHFIIRPFQSAFLDAVLGIRNLWGLIG